ncbi:hypothetical protein ACFCYN_21695 [Gottfriedia sp. NPDC056225]|uniref:hypothetical protein n=1 Tax=Gottfriedia sp. NPDC056225 TaxID=3345751 RepID=UPI0035DDBED7
MEKDKTLMHLHSGIEKQVPDVWDKIKDKLVTVEQVHISQESTLINERVLYKSGGLNRRLLVVAAVCVICLLSLRFTPVLASIQQMYDKIFSSEHIDDSGVRAAIKLGQHQAINQTYFDATNDISVHFEGIMTDDKETKLLLTYHSKTKDLKNYYIDIFEGDSSINLTVGNNKKMKLHNVGWGSRYYDRKENKVVEALSFESIKKYKGQDIHLEIENLTIYGDKQDSMVPAIWNLDFKLANSAISNRETIEINKNFAYKNIEYKIKKVEFSALETRVVVAGSDTKVFTDESGMRYTVMSKLEEQFLNSRKFDKELGYTVNNKKSGIFLKSAGEKVVPIFSKGEVAGEDDEYVMIFAPVKDRRDCTLEVGNDIKIILIKK